MKWLKIFFLKRKARKHYMAYIAMKVKYSCGNNLIDEITGGELSYQINACNDTMCKLSKLDPSAPKTFI